MKHNLEFRTRSAFNVAYCGVMCALAILVMFAAVSPSLTYIMPALAGIIIWSVREQCNFKWAMMTYASTAILSLFLVPEMESKTFLILIFGYYPLLREKINGITFFPARVAAKLAVFNLAAVFAYSLVVNVFGISDVLDGLEGFGEYAVYVFWAMGNAAFFFYDFALTHIFYAFSNWVKPIINKKIK
jgi:hypothetical protein